MRRTRRLGLDKYSALEGADESLLLASFFVFTKYYTVIHDSPSGSSVTLKRLSRNADRWPPVTLKWLRKWPTKIRAMATNVLLRQQKG